MKLHTAKKATASEIRKSLGISKKDISIAQAVIKEVLKDDGIRSK